MEIKKLPNETRILDNEQNVIFRGPHQAAREVYIRMSILTRKSTDRMALSFRNTKPSGRSPIALRCWYDVLSELNSTLASITPAFNEERFLELAGYEEKENKLLS